MQDSGLKILHSLEGKVGTIGIISWSPDGKILAYPSTDCSIYLYSLSTGTIVKTLSGPNTGYSNVAFDPTGKLLASLSGDQTLRLWDIDSNLILWENRVPGNNHFTIAYDPNGQFIACGGSYQGVSIIEASSGTKLYTLFNKISTAWTIALAFDPTGQILACGTSDYRIQIWNFKSGELISILVGHTDWILGVKFDLSGDFLISSSADKTIKIWGLKKNTVLRTLEGHTAAVLNIDINDKENLIASRGFDNTIRFWEFSSGKCFAVISDTSSYYGPTGLNFHPTIPVLAAVSGDNRYNEEGNMFNKGMIRVWKVDCEILRSNKNINTIIHASAKIVLVGESGAGKSYLAHRIATGTAPYAGSIKTTHGMKFWPLNPEKLGISTIPSINERRSIMLWDMGGQQEYRLVHQLFLQDTTLALVLFDPTRGHLAFEEVEAWSKYLEKQLQGRNAVKILVGSKLDEVTNIIDYQRLNRLIKDGNFITFCETSAITGRGMTELCQAIDQALDWHALNKNSRPELFQRIYDQISTSRERGDIVLRLSDLRKTLNTYLITDEDNEALNVVVDQLAEQGMIVKSHLNNGESVLILQINEIEKYAGSLIIAARNNIRGIPALDISTIVKSDFIFPGMVVAERLPLDQEKYVLESTISLLLQSGICFEHERLLIFPTLFTSVSGITDSPSTQAASIYYDFSGPLDNIYASLIAELVYKRDFGHIRLWADRAEFEIGNQGLCGLYKIARSNGFARIDIYFEDITPLEKQSEFIDFIEEHLRFNGIDIQEHVEITCQCTYVLKEDMLRQRISFGHMDVSCPVCDSRHKISKGTGLINHRQFNLAEQTWALKTDYSRQRKQLTEEVAKAFDQTLEAQYPEEPIRILHLSDLHFNEDTLVSAMLQPLIEDIYNGLNIKSKKIDYLVISGDFTDRGSPQGFEKAYEFVSNLITEYGLSAERCIFVPGNHDIRDLSESFEKRQDKDGNEVQVRSSKYPFRIKPFSDEFYHKLFLQDYPIDYSKQGISIPFWELGFQFLTFNSCWQIDQFKRKNSGINETAIANALELARKQEVKARDSGLLSFGKPIFKIAVWHHAIAGPDQMVDINFLELLEKNGVKLAMHGDVHELRRDLLRFWNEDKLYIIGSGAFGSTVRPESTPRHYNLLEISRDLKTVKVHTRQQPKKNGAWKGWNEWPTKEGKDSRVPYYTIEF